MSHRHGIMCSDPSVLMGSEGCGLGRFGEPRVTYRDVISKAPVD